MPPSTMPLERPIASKAPVDHYAAPDQSATGRAWRWLTAVAVLGTIGLNYYSNVYPFAGQTMGMVSAKYPTLFTPAGAAFSIWGAIFLALVAYAVWQLLPGQRHLSLPDAVAKPLTLACLATSTWVVLFAYELILPSVAVMLLILGSLIVVSGRVQRRIASNAAPALAGVPFSLYLGWISVASVVNITIGIRQLGWQTAEGVSVTLTLGLIFVVVVLALLVSRIFRDMVFPVVVAWALAWVWVARLHEVPELGWAALAGATVCLVVGVALAWGGPRKTAWQRRDEAAKAIEAEIAARNASRASQ